jgi:hypothetical protein
MKKVLVLMTVNMMRMKRAVIVFLFAALIAGVAWAQTGSGSVNGVVQDKTGAVIVNANVSLVNTDTNVELKSVTNDAGLFVFPAVTNGPYKLIANSAGMAQYEAKLTVQVDVAAAVSVTLLPAGAKTTIVVGDVTPLVNTDNAELGSTLEARRIEELPLNGRNVFSLMATVPGTTPSDVNGNFRTFGEGVGTHDITIDNAPLTDMAYAAQTVNRPPGLESIQEFTVDTNATSAKSARPTDIIMVTKSGTNQWHGSLFETNRDNSYGVAHYEQDLPGSPLGKLIRNEYGGSAGGPVYIPKVYNGKNKSFWFFSYEALSLRQGTSTLFKVPDAKMQSGDFSGDIVGGVMQQLYNPFAEYTTPGDPSTRPMFVNNKIGTAVCTSPLGDPVNGCMSPLYKFLLSDLPQPNITSVNPFLGYNLSAPLPISQNQATYVLRVDQRFSDKDLVYARLSRATETTLRGSTAGPVTLDGNANTTAATDPNDGFSANWTHTFSPRLVNDLTLSATYVKELEGGGGDTTKNWDAVLGLSNPSGSGGFPVIDSIGMGLKPDSNYLAPHYNYGQFFGYFVLDDNATKLIGKHEIQFGVHLRYDQLTYLPQQQHAAGAVGWYAASTALYDAAYPDRTQGYNNTGAVAGSAYMGFGNYSYRSVKGKYYMTRKEDAGYVQDNYKFNQRLKLNFGLRWDFNPFPVDKQGAITGFDLKTNALVTSGSLAHLEAVHATSAGYVAALESLGITFETPAQAGLPSNLVNNNFHDIGPHLGFAYRALDGRKAFVLRGGYALNFYPLAIWGWNDRMKNNAPWRQDPPLVGPYDFASSSPDGVQNYGLITSPATNALYGFTNLISGLNTANVFNGAASAADALSNGDINDAFFDQHSPSPRVNNWNLTLEKELVDKMVLRLSYIGNHTSHLDMYQDLNAYVNYYGNYAWYTNLGTLVPPGPDGGLYGDQVVRPLAVYGTLGVPGGYTGPPNPLSPWSDIQEFGRYGWGNSWGGVAELERHFSKGYGFQVFYDLVDSFSAGGYGWESGVEPATSWPVGQVSTDLHQRIKQLYYGQDTSIPKQEVRYNFIVELPFGRGKWIGGNIPKALDAFIGGWQISTLGTMASNSFYLDQNFQNTFSMYPTGAPVKYYGRKAPVQDCRSGTCINGYLLYNGFIPANQVNQPGGVEGVPAGYAPAYAPLNLNPADTANYLTNNVPVILSNTPSSPSCPGTATNCIVETGLGTFNPFNNRVMQSTWLFDTDSSIIKSFNLKERVKFKIEGDFFNVFNNPGREFANNDPSGNGLGDGSGIVLTNYSMNSPRVVQISAHLTF